MSQTVLLGDICKQITDGTHSTVKDNADGEYYLLSAKNIKNKVVITDNERKIDQTTLIALRKRTKTEKNDVLVTSVGTIGETAYVDDDNPNYEFQRSVLILKPNTDYVDPRYLYYYMRSLKKTFNSMATGAVQKCLFIGQMKNVPINIPDLDTQVKIADMLSIIDEKIELNRKMNETLEQIGLAHFRHYFIDNSGVGRWKQGRINDIAEVTDFVANGSFASLKDNVTLYDREDYALYIRTTDYKNGFNTNLKYVDRKSYDFLKKSSLNGSEFIISNVGDVGTVFKAPIWLKKPMTLASNVIMVRNSIYNNYLYLYFRSVDGQFALSNITAGSAQPKFNKTEFRNLKIVIPNDESLTEFNKSYDLISGEILNLNGEINNLNTLRDMLLPRLLSGKMET